MPQADRIYSPGREFFFGGNVAALPANPRVFIVPLDVRTSVVPDSEAQKCMEVLQLQVSQQLGLSEA